MSEPFIFINRAAVREGKLEEFKRSWKETAETAGENSRLLHFGLYLSEDGSEETTLQVHQDAESMGYHMKLVAEHIQSAHEYLDFGRMNIQIYGNPTEAVLEQMRELAGAGVTISLNSPVAGFSRLVEDKVVG